MKNKCINIVPIYYGTKGTATQGTAEYSNDYLFRCHTNYDIQTQVYSQSSTIAELCKDCKKYDDGRIFREEAERIKAIYYGRRDKPCN